MTLGLGLGPAQSQMTRILRIRIRPKLRRARVTIIVGKGLALNLPGLERKQSIVIVIVVHFRVLVHVREVVIVRPNITGTASIVEATERRATPKARERRKGTGITSASASGTGRKISGEVP